MDIKWYKIFENVTELELAIVQNKGISIEINTQKIAIFRSPSGLWALEDNCPHQNLPIAGSVCINSDTISCPFHGLLIKLKTGQAGRYSTLKSYPIQVRRDGVFIEV